MRIQTLSGFAGFLFYLVAATHTHAADVSLDLPTILQYALRENPELKAKRYALGIAEGRAQQAGLLFQHNPRFSVEMETPASGRSGTSFEFNLNQNVEVAGQREHRYEAAVKNLAHARLSVEDSERVLRLEVVQSFFRLLASQQIIAELRELLAGQKNLLQAGQKRFAREDISILELNTLRLDRDEVRNELANKMRARVSLDKQLRVLMALQDDGSLQVTGDLPDLLTRHETVPAREALQACILANRPDVKAAKLAVEVREAELRLAQARRIPDVALGPRYKRDNNQNFVGGEIVIPLPFFNRNQEEIATAVANRDTSRAEFERRILAAKQEVDSAYKEIDVSKGNLAGYETDYIHDIGNILALTRRAYESGEMTIFEFSNLRSRLAETRLQYLDATIGYLGAVAELEAQSPWCFADARANQSVP